MVLHLKEYEDTGSVYARMLHYYDILPDYLHKMTAEEITKHINRNGVVSAMYQKIAVISYIKWLSDNYSSEIDVSLSDLNYELQRMLEEGTGGYVGFYTLTELKQAIEMKLQDLESENTSRNADYSGLKALYFMEWYGIPTESAISVKLSDVSEDGKTIYVPSEKRTVNIDDNAVANYFADYKSKTGFKRKKDGDKETLYTQNTFLRTTSSVPISLKTFYNIKTAFQSISHDIRFDKKRVYNAGRYYEMLQIEQDSGDLFMGNDEWTESVIEKVFNKEFSLQARNMILRNYRLYKQGYIENL